MTRVQTHLTKFKSPAPQSPRRLARWASSVKRVWLSFTSPALSYTMRHPFPPSLKWTRKKIRHENTPVSFENDASVCNGACFQSQRPEPLTCPVIHVRGAFPLSRVESEFSPGWQQARLGLGLRGQAHCHCASSRSASRREPHWCVRRSRHGVSWSQDGSKENAIP